ncbi:MAG TPA: DNA mismatch repair endonuclease MutL [Methanoregulaceae archaeon]|nr:DNA mismatch repair endonuclease MutL [Methanoregulaceae archaeon]HPQ75225.1 DNA mismatch repair endonuclease MutL [Methanoregulaceae archaeon]
MDEKKMTGPGNVIRVLDPTTANQIAAGEVVERPASVVKELVENSIDSGAGRIEVEITSTRDAISRIRVTDDGCGISPADADLVFTRHSTSKIERIEDLTRCATLGFRGEALASIASVSRVTLLSRQRGSGNPTGTLIVCAGGEIIEKREAGSPEGTTVTVDDIFFNTPARKKFQRSPKAEIGYITSVMERIVLSWPHLSFRFVHNGREKFATPRGGDLRSAVVALFGNEYARSLIEVGEEGELVRVKGYISRPSLSRQSAYQVFLSVNSRVVYSRSLIEAVREGYGTLLPADRFPVAFLDITVRRNLVDVNVHPAKRQIRISREEEVRADIKKIIHEALRGQDLVPGRREDLVPDNFPAARYSPSTVEPSVIREPTLAELQVTERRLRQTSLLPDGGADRLPIPRMQVIGQFGDTYIVAFTADEDLVILDQHAAHERILYDQIREKSGRQVSQELISPVTIHLSTGESDFLREKIDILSAEGFSIEEFGNGAFLVRAVPVFLGRCEDPSDVREMLSGILDEGLRTGVDAREKIRRLVACRGAIKAGTVCTGDQCSRLVSQLMATRDPWTCPHGRPTMIVFPKKKIDTLFKRL